MRGGQETASHACELSLAGERTSKTDGTELERSSTHNGSRQGKGGAALGEASIGCPLIRRGGGGVEGRRGSAGSQHSENLGNAVRASYEKGWVKGGQKRGPGKVGEPGKHRHEIRKGYHA